MEQSISTVAGKLQKCKYQTTAGRPRQFICFVVIPPQDYKFEQTTLVKHKIEILYIEILKRLKQF